MNDENGTLTNVILRTVFAGLSSLNFYLRNLCKLGQESPSPYIIEIKGDLVKPEVKTVQKGLSFAVWRIWFLSYVKFVHSSPHWCLYTKVYDIWRQICCFLIHFHIHNHW